MSGCINLSEQKRANGQFVEEILHHTGVNVRNCYQCGKCSAGCPLSFAMDIRPNRVIRMIQLGMKDEVINSRTIWVCATCATCTARCPRGVDPASIMDGLRVMAMKAGKTANAKNEALLHKLFMDSISKHGRLYELGMLLGLNLKSGNVFKDADIGLKMFLRGKIKILPPKIKGVNEVKKIIEAAARLEGEQA
jgi:heterodisulfide reductase subunit C